MKKDTIKVSYDLNKKIKTKLVIIAENKGISQTKLLENYIKDGIKKDKEFLTSHLD
ncbi:hypothetical protein [Methanobrevibacter curvatus]|uniref:Uncharacterized protein n=1 Tax=Methanobrevibacter curvatus TaxID=49547 RepID=A0A166B579_9EURY|nr:hypothetical protein [Methanobrevibacter curvatus]KZX12879.1 hypothetical protein MBCUR_08400 [Methanobrevibacter curvatus]